MEIGISLMAVAAVLGFLKRESRATGLLIFSVLWILMGLNTHNADFINGYQYLYNFKIENSSDVTYGYLALEQICWALGLDFMQFKMLTSLFGLGLLTMFVRRYSRNPNTVLVLYMLMPFFYDIVQFKFFLAASVAIYGLRFLIDRSRLCVVKFIIVLALSALIHPASVLFGFFIIGVFNKSTAFKISIVTALATLFLTVSGLGQVVGLTLTDSVKGAAYFTSASRFGWIPYFVSVVGVVVVSHLSYSSMGATSNLEEPDPPARFEVFFERAQYAFLPLIALVPLSVQNFYRPIRSFNVLFLMHLTSVVFDDSNKIAKNEKTGLVALAFLWVVFTQVVVYMGVIDTVLVDELSNNLLWS